MFNLSVNKRPVVKSKYTSGVFDLRSIIHDTLKALNSRPPITADACCDECTIDKDWDESKHHRGQPENAGQFGPGGTHGKAAKAGGTSGTSAAETGRRGDDPTHTGSVPRSEPGASGGNAEGLGSTVKFETTSPSDFHRAIYAASRASSSGAAVHVYSPDEYADMRVFLTADKSAGFALKGDDIVSVFKHPESQHKKVANAALAQAIQEGGRRLDCFDTVLPTFYSNNHFRAVSRLKFDDEFAPENWDYKKMAPFNGGKPDVVFMVYDPDYTEMYKPGDGEIAPDYDTAEHMQIEAVKAAIAKHPTGYGAGETHRQLFTEQETAGLPAQASQPVDTPEALYTKSTEALDQLQTWLNKGKGVASQLGYKTMPGPPEDTDLTQPGGMLFVAPLKSQKRAAEKVAEDYKGDWSKLTDVTRCTIAVDTMDELSTVVDKLKQSGMKLAAQPSDRFAKPTSCGYRDLMLKVEFPNGVVGEVQLHIKPILVAKNQGHDYYDVMRRLESRPTDIWSDDEKKAWQQNFDASSALYNKAWQEASGVHDAAMPDESGYEYFERDGAVFRRKGHIGPVDDVLHGDQWVPYQGDRTAPVMYGNVIDIADDPTNDYDPNEKRDDSGQWSSGGSTRKQRDTDTLTIKGPDRIRPLELDVHKNPTAGDLRKLALQNPYREVRLLRVDGDDTVYAWSANEALHYEVARALNAGNLYQSDVAKWSPGGKLTFEGDFRTNEPTRVKGGLKSWVDEFKEEQHPRGTGEHGGEFVKKGSAVSEKSTAKSESAGQGKSTGHIESVTYNQTTKPPATLNGVALKSWKPPKTNDTWETLAGDGIDEPDLPAAGKYKDDKGKQWTKNWGAGVIVQEPDGRVWLIKPKDQYGGYKHTWPKGTVEQGMSFQATAIKEAYEETGLHVELLKYAGDVERDTSIARYYFAKRVGGTPADASWEAEGVALVDPAEINKYLNRSVDRKMAEKFLKSAETKKGTEATESAGKSESTGLSESAKGSESTGTSKPAGNNESTKQAESAGAIKLSDMTKVGEKLGSNPGGTYTDKNGKKYYVKLSKSPDHAKNEILASRLYEAAGAPILKAMPVDMDGKLGTATEWATGVKNIDRHNTAQRKEAQQYFAVHAWLANWDAAGLDYDNQGVVNGKMTTLDPGGSLIYRAQGTPKGDAFGDKVGEWQSLRSSNNAQANAIFGDMTTAQLKASAKLVANVSDTTIRDLVDQQGPGTPEQKKQLSARLIKRKADIVSKAAATHDSKSRLLIDVNLGSAKAFTYAI